VRQPAPMRCNQRIVFAEDLRQQFGEFDGCGC
jgi:hypothetical protein